MDENFEHFRDFMAGFTAAAELHRHAIGNGSFVECVCLGATVLDSMLRVGLVLQHQLKTNTREIPRELVLQNENDKALSERAIYRRARDAGLINQAELESLGALYDDRNRVIHRYVISRISTVDVIRIAAAYEQAIRRLAPLVTHLEAEQIRLGVGITPLGPDADRATLEAFADEKHTPELGALLRSS